MRSDRNSIRRGTTGLKLNSQNDDVKYNYAYFPVVFGEKFHKTRDEVYENLRLNNVYTRKYFYPLTSAFDCYKEQFDANKTPVALDVSRRVLTLPIYPELAIEDVDRICDVILSMA